MEQQELKQIIDIINRVTELLYQENIVPAYAQLVAVLPRLEKVITDFSEEVQQELTENLRNALEAMEDGDNTLLADILQYEVLEKLRGF